jgi:hypothetical protein
VRFISANSFFSSAGSVAAVDDLVDRAQPERLQERMVSPAIASTLSGVVPPEPLTPR